MCMTVFLAKTLKSLVLHLSFRLEVIPGHASTFNAIFIYLSHYLIIILYVFWDYTLHSNAGFLANSFKVLRNLSESFQNRNSVVHVLQWAQTPGFILFPKLVMDYKTQPNCRGHQSILPQRRVLEPSQTFRLRHRAS